MKINKKLIALLPIAVLIISYFLTANNRTADALCSLIDDSNLSQQKCVVKKASNSIIVVSDLGRVEAMALCKEVINLAHQNDVLFKQGGWHLEIYPPNSKISTAFCILP